MQHYRNIEKTFDAQTYQNNPRDAWSRCEENRTDEEKAYAFLELSIPALRSQRRGTFDIKLRDGTRANDNAT